MSTNEVNCLSDLDKFVMEIQKINIDDYKIAQSLLKGGLDFLDRYSKLITNNLEKYQDERFKDPKGLRELHEKLSKDIAGLKHLTSKQRDLYVRDRLLKIIPKVRVELETTQARLNANTVEFNKLGKYAKFTGPIGNALDLTNIYTKAFSGDGKSAATEIVKVLAGKGGGAVAAGTIAAAGAILGGAAFALSPLGAAAIGLGFAFGNWGGGETAEWVMQQDWAKPFVDPFLDEIGGYIDDSVDFVKDKFNNDQNDPTNNSSLPNKEEQNTPNQNNPDKEEKNKPNNQSNNPDKKPHCPWKDGLDPHRTPDTQVHDPLVLDLDGDGIETIAANGLSGSLFDHNNNGIRIATGWVGKDDGILVRDINGNGQIDNALELMSDKVRLSNGQTAAHGYEALADLDTDGNGKVDAADAAFSELRIWKDENQDGISQTDELHTLDKFNIQSFNTSYEEVDQDLGNQNILGQSGTYTKTDGSTAQMGDVWFAADETKIKFAKEVQLTAEQMQTITLPGSGRVRQLREAAALSSTLNNIVQEYSKANTKEEQISLLSELMVEWAKTDPEFAEASKYRLSSELALAPRLTNFSVSSSSGSSGRGSSRSGGRRSSSSSHGTVMLTPLELDKWRKGITLDEETKQAFENSKHKIAILDAFKGTRSRTFYYGTSDQAKKIIQTTDAAFGRLTNKIYKGLLFQTRLRPYLNEINLKIENNKFVFDFTSVHEVFEQVHAQNPQKAFVDLAEFVAYGSHGDNGQTNPVMPELSALLTKYMIEAEQEGTLAEYGKLLEQDAWQKLGFIKGDDQNNNLSGNELSNYLAGNAGNDHLYGYNGKDVLNGGEGNDYLNGGKDDDVLNGGSGNDQLYGENGEDVLNGGEGDDELGGGEGSDTLDGGAGDDRLYGGSDADTYLFAKGHGRDIVDDYTYADQNNTLRFTGAVSGDAVFGREGDDLTVQAYGSDDQVAIANYFSGDSNRRYELVFDDATVNTDDIRQKAFSVSGNENGNSISGWDTADTVNGLGGNDYLYGYNGNDVLNGGEGNDYLNGGKDDDVLNGGSGNDQLYGEKGEDILNGGEGDDRLEGGSGSDTYTFTKGHHSDTIYDYDSQAGNVDTLRFDGIRSSEVLFAKDGHDLVLSGYEDGDSVRVRSFFSHKNYAVERFVFDDVTIENPDFASYMAQTNQMVQTMSVFGGTTDGLVTADSTLSVGDVKAPLLVTPV